MSISVLFNDNPDEAIYLPQAVGHIVRGLCDHSVGEDVKDNACVYVTMNAFRNINVGTKTSMDMSYYAFLSLRLRAYDACELYMLIDGSELFNNDYNKRFIKSS